MILNFSCPALNKVVVSMALGLALQSASAQEPVKRPQVDVAAIRLSAPGGNSGYISLNPGRFAVHNLSVRRMMYIAYKVKASQITGGPGWVDSDRYDVTATGEDTGGDNVPLMLQTLLEDRFKLKVHRETKEGPVYDLTVAKGGVTMPESKPGSCAVPDLSKAVSVTPNQKWCGTWQGSGAGFLSGAGISMRDIAGIGFRSLTGQLSLELDKPVIDQTGLTGLFDINLKWSPEDAAAKTASLGSSEQPVQNADDGPSIFTAVREQLGLELKPGKGPVTMLVIDSVERPSEN